MKAAVKKSDSPEFFEIEYQETMLMVKCLATLDSWNLKEFKAIVGEAIIFQLVSGVIIDLQSQPVESEAFQTIVQAGQTLKLLGKRLVVKNGTSEFLRSVGANGLSGIIRVDQDDGGKAAEVVERASLTDTFPPETEILIVDDIQSVRALLRTFLGDLGFNKVSEARGAEEAIKLLDQSVNSETPFRIVISDWYMPGVNGLQLHRHLRDDPRFGHTAFILLTVETEKHNVLKAFQEGVKYYLVKPFKMDTISEKFREIWAKEGDK